MKLIDGPLLELPEEDGWRDELASRLLLLMLGALLMRLAVRTWPAVEAGGLAGAIPTMLFMALAVQIALLSIADIDLEEHGRTIGYGIVASLTLLVIAMLAVSGSSWITKLGSDVLAFTSYSAELVVEGQNPFAMSMAPSLELPGAPEAATYRTDGSIVTQWSYPAGTLIPYGAQYALVGRTAVGIRLTSIIGVGILAALLVHAVPAVYAPAAPLSLVAGQNLWFGAAGGLNDMWWVLFAAGALLLWARDKRLLAAGTLGVACAMKQQPWVILPFLAVWVARESDSIMAFVRTGGSYIAAGLASFGLINLPWILQNPQAWLTSVLVPLGAGGDAPLLSRGVGIAALNYADAGTIPHGAFFGIIAIVVATLMAAYWRWFETVKWAAWVAPMVVFYWTPRSLPSYFYWVVPLALLAVLASHGQLRGQTYGREVTA